MRKFTLGLLVGLTTLGLGATVSAQTLPETVQFNLNVNQPALFDTSKRDTFKGIIDDRSGTTNFEVVCSAGSSAFLGLSRSDEACAVKGNGSIKNPNNPSQTAQRLNYSGGFKIEAKADGYTDATTIQANYLRVGSAGAENKSFGGSLILMPEKPSASASALGQKLIKSLQEKATGTEAVQFDTQIDSIRFENFVVPAVGQANSAACSWTGDKIYAYANDVWQAEFDVKCGDVAYRLEGSVSLVPATTGSDHNEEYVVNLVVPGAGGGDPFAAADPFATVDGVTGVLKMTNSGRKTEDGVYENVAVSGELVGNGVPLELVRGYGQIMIILARTYFGA